MADDIKVGGVALELKIDDKRLYSDTKRAADDARKQFSQGFKAAGQDMERSFKSSFRQVSDSGASLANNLTGMFKKLGAAVIAAFSIQKIKEFGQTAIEQAAKVIAQESALTQTFREYEGVAAKAMQEVAKESGILETRLQGVGTQIYAFAKTSGMDSVTALNMMKEALQATADSAAYYDRSLEDTAESLKSFLKGNYANDAALGVSATETTRNAAAMKLYGQSFKDLSEAQKQLTLLQMVKDANALSGAMGQAAREADGWENVIGNLKEAWNQLLAAVGKPILQGAIIVVKRLTEWISSLATYAKAASQALGELFGWSSDETAVTAANTAQTASSISESVDNQNQLTQAVAKTNAEVKRGIAGFDKLNLITKSTLNSATGNDNSSGIDSNLNSALPQSTLNETEGGIDRITNKIQQLKERLKEIFEPVVAFYNEHIKPIVDTVTEFANGIMKSTKEWFDNLDWKPLSDALEEFFDSSKEFIDEVSPGLSWLWENVVLPMGTLLVEKILPPLVSLLASINRFLAPIISALIEDFKPLWENVLKPALDTIVEQFNKIVNKIKPKLEELGKEIGEALKEWKPLIDDLSESLGPLLGMLLSFLGGTLGGALEAGLNSLTIIARGIGGVARAIKGLKEGDWDEVWAGLELVGKGLDEVVVAPFKHTWAALSEGFKSTYEQAQKYGDSLPELGTSFAVGGIVSAPTLAVVGDNPGAGSGNPEVIAPLNKLQSIINTSGGRADSSDAKIVDILTRIYETLMLQRNDNRQSESRTYEMNGEPVFKEMVRLNDEYKVRYGRSAF